MIALSTITNYVSIGVYAISGALLLFGVLLGLWRGFAKSLVRLLTIVACAAISYLIASPLTGAFSGIIKSTIEGQALGSFDLGEALGVSPTLTEIIMKLPAAFITPIVFMVLFCVLSIIFFIVYKIVSKIVKLFTLFKTKGIISRLLGATLGVVSSCVVIVVFFFPIANYLRLAGDVADAAAGIGDKPNATIEQIGDIADDIGENPVISISESIGKPMFNSMTAFTVKGEKVRVAVEVAYILDLVQNVKPLSVGLKNYGPDQSAAVLEIANGIDGSVLVPSIICEILPPAAEAWMNGEKFMGIDSISKDVPESLSGTVNDLLEIFATMDRTTLKGDLTTIANIFGVFSDHGAFTVLSDNAGQDEVLNLFTKEGFVSDFLYALNSNPRFRPVVAGVTNLGISAIGQAIGLPKDNAEVYTNLTGEMASILNKTYELSTDEERIEYLTTELDGVFEKYGVSIDENESKILVECLTNDLVSAEELSGTDVEEYFSALSESISSDNVVSSDKEDNKDNNGKNGGKGKRPSSESAEKLKEIKLAKQLAKVETLEHKVFTVEMMLVTKESLENLTEEEIVRDGELITEALTEIVKFYDSVNSVEGNMSMETLGQLDLGALSNAVTCFNSSTLFQNVSAPLVAGSLQNLDLGLPSEAIDKLAEGIANDKKGGEGEGYTQEILSSVSSMANLTSKLQNENLSTEELEVVLEEILTDLTPDSADLIATIMTPAFIKKHVSTLNDEQAGKVSFLVSDIFVNFGNLDNQGLSKEEIKHESQTLSALFHIALDAKEGNESTVFNEVDENGNVIVEGRVGKTLDELYSMVVNSKVVSKTIIDLVDKYGSDPFGVGSKLTAANKTTIVKTIEDHIADGKDNKLLIASAAVVGLDITITGSTVTVNN